MNQPTEPKADKSGVRRHNLSLVLRTVHDAGETTRAAVAARVGLTRPAVSSSSNNSSTWGSSSNRARRSAARRDGRAPS